MLIRQYEVWIADLQPKFGSEPGKIRPVLIVQSNILNQVNHNSTLICPITSNITKDAQILRVNIKKGQANVNESCDIMIDQIRAIDNTRLIKKVGDLPDKLIEKVRNNLLIILDAE
jgi:mRNA interferase MazF